MTAHLDQHIEHFNTLTSVRTPRLVRAIGWLMVVFIIAIMAFMTLAPWVQTTSGAGSVTALNPNDRLQEINALVSGRIEEWYVRDGSAVEAGDPIAKIADNDPNLIESLAVERAQIIAKRNAAQSALATTQIDVERTRDLFNKGLASRREYEQAQIRLDDLQARVAEASAEVQRISVSLSRQSAQIVTAPRDGVILQVNAGDTSTFVNAGAMLASFVPSNVDRAVEIFIDGRDVALVRPGARARLQFEGWPAVQFSGWPSVAVGTFAGEVVAIDPSANARGQFRVLITETTQEGEPPWPDERFIRFGASARGWILLEEVSVGYEVWRQLNNFPPSLPDNASGAT